MKLIYIGRRTNSNGVIAHYYQTEQGTHPGWKKSLKAAARVGTILEVHESTPGSGSIMMDLEHAPVIVGHHEVAAEVLKWEAEDHANWILHRKRQQEKKFNQETVTPLDRAMRQLKVAALPLNKTERAAFVAWIITELA